MEIEDKTTENYTFPPQNVSEEESDNESGSENDSMVIEGKVNIDKSEIEINSQRSCPNSTQDMYADSEFSDLSSDEEFSLATEQVKNYNVKNYNRKSNAANGMKAPAKYHHCKFKPTICTLNNNVVFISTGTNNFPHIPNVTTSGHACFCFL